MSFNVTSSRHIVTSYGQISRQDTTYLTRKHSGSVQVGEGGRWGGIGQIIGRDVHGLGGEVIISNADGKVQWCALIVPVRR